MELQVRNEERMDADERVDDQEEDADPQLQGQVQEDGEEVHGVGAVGVVGEREGMFRD
jgi:hypothetical protein